MPRLLSHACAVGPRILADERRIKSGGVEGAIRLLNRKRAPQGPRRTIRNRAISVGSSASRTVPAFGRPDDHAAYINVRPEEIDPLVAHYGFAWDIIDDSNGGRIEICSNPTDPDACATR